MPLYSPTNPGPILFGQFGEPEKYISTHKVSLLVILNQLRALHKAHNLSAIRFSKRGIITYWGDTGEQHEAFIFLDRGIDFSILYDGVRFIAMENHTLNETLARDKRFAHHGEQKGNFGRYKCGRELRFDAKAQEITWGENKRLGFKILKSPSDRDPMRFWKGIANETRALCAAKQSGKTPQWLFSPVLENSKATSLAASSDYSFGSSDDEADLVKTSRPGQLIGDRVYLEMKDYSAAGTRLDTVLEGSTSFDEGTVITWVLQLLKAMLWYHEQNWIHRDIKPSNFMLMKKGDIRLIDLGLAIKLPAGQGAVLADAVGTPNYNAPEVGVHNPRDVSVNICHYHRYTVDEKESIYFYRRAGIFSQTQAIDMHGLGRIILSLTEKLRESTSLTTQCLTELSTRLLARMPGERPTARQALQTMVDLSEALRLSQYFPAYSLEHQAKAMLDLQTGLTGYFQDHRAGVKTETASNDLTAEKISNAMHMAFPRTAGTPHFSVEETLAIVAVLDSFTPRILGQSSLCHYTWSETQDSGKDIIFPAFFKPLESLFDRRKDGVKLNPVQQSHLAIIKQFITTLLEPLQTSLVGGEEAQQLGTLITQCVSRLQAPSAHQSNYERGVQGSTDTSEHLHRLFPGGASV